MELIVKEKLYNRILEEEQIARNELLNAECGSDEYWSILVGLNVRTALKHEIADTPAIDKVFLTVSFEEYEKVKEERRRFLNIAYNAIVLGQLDEIYDKERLLKELGCSEEEYNEIMG